MTKVSELVAATELDGSEYYLIIKGGSSKKVRADDAAKVALAKTPRVDKVALGDADTPGGLVAWQNPAGVPIIVTNITLHLTTSGADRVDYNDGAEAGIVANGTTYGDTLTSNGNFPLDSDTVPTLTRCPSFVPGIVPSGNYVTISTSDGSAAGVTGYAYIYWHVA